MIISPAHAAAGSVKFAFGMAFICTATWEVSLHPFSLTIRETISAPAAAH